MPIGLRKAAAKFQKLMHKILEDHPFIFVYLDIILANSICKRSHEWDLETIFKRLEDAGLIIIIKKSESLKSRSTSWDTSSA